MVLQQGSPVVWGRAAPGSRITVAIAGASASAVAGPDERWTVTLGALAPGGPHDMRISGDGEVTVHDVLVGEVWVAAGQSNMVVDVRSARDGEREIARADCSRIRLFQIARLTAVAPARDVGGAWTACTHETLPHFSAVAWYFGRDLRELLHAPVGLVVGAWGGTSIQAWLPPSPIVHAEPTTSATVHQAAFELSFMQMRLLPKDRAARPVPVAPGPGASGWHTEATAGSRATFEAAPSVAATGRLSVVLVGDHARATLTTPLGANGRLADWTAFAALAFRARGQGSFRLSIATGTGEVWASDPFNAPPEWGQVVVALDSLHAVGAGGRRPLAADAVASLGFTIARVAPRTPGGAWNGMLAPLAPLRVRGVLWYQGEADAGLPSRYGERLKRLVRDWRAAWSASDLPFLVVQLPGYQPPRSDAGAGHWAELRQAQLEVLELPGTAVVTTIDLGDPNDIHPANKADVGKRLALAAARLVYGKPVVASGPRLAAIVLDQGRLRIRFTETGGGLAGRGEAPLTGFTVSADGSAFVPASARVVDGSTVEVWSESVPAPVEVRYAWADDPTCNLANAEGLPAVPFRARVGAGGSP